MKSYAPTWRTFLVGYAAFFALACALVWFGLNAVITLVATAAQPQLLPDDAFENVTFTLTITDPNREGHTPEVEFYEGYGLLFEPDARGDGPICVERITSTILDSTFPDLTVEPERRCLTLDTLRSLLWRNTP